ncbi:hypothetical protein Tco_0324980 [Tanacetum coccineum]
MNSEVRGSNVGVGLPPEDLLENPSNSGAYSSQTSSMMSIQFTDLSFVKEYLVSMEYQITQLYCRDGVEYHTHIVLDSRSGGSDGVVSWLEETEISVGDGVGNVGWVGEDGCGVEVARDYLWYARGVDTRSQDAWLEEGLVSAYMRRGRGEIYHEVSILGFLRWCGVGKIVLRLYEDSEGGYWDWTSLEGVEICVEQNNIIMVNPPPDHNEFPLAAEAAPDNMNSWVEWDEDEEEEDPKEDPEMEE